MARPKRSSVVLRKAEKRQAELQSIDPALDLGNQLTVESYSDLIEALRAQLALYNSTLSIVDDQSRQIKATELKLRSLSEQMLLGVAAKYGKDSREYGKAGGVPKSERRRSVQKEPPKEPQSSEPLQRFATAPTNGQTSEPVNGNGKTLVF